jgi:hypothetical protein
MKKIVKEFYEKQIGYNKFFEKKKKISFDINDRFLEIIDKVAKLTNNSRTVTVNALIGAGMAPCFQLWEKTWKEFLNDKRYEKIKPSIEKLIKNLKKLKEEYQIR